MISLCLRVCRQNCSRLQQGALVPTYRTLATDAQVEQFHRDGFIIMRNLFSKEEIALVRDAIEQDVVFDATDNIIRLKDNQGGSTKLNLWSNPGDGTLGLLTRSRRVVSTMQQLLGGEIAHYHSKIMSKEPRSGGAWNWHQDYGYWYKDYFLAPHMATAYFAVDPQTLENGCLRLLRGSTQLGRIDHWSVGEQQGADPERIDLARELYEDVPCELNSGDVVFFHSLTIHGSTGNVSDTRRLAFASAFTRVDNIQWRDAYIPCFRVDEVDDDALLKGGVAMSSLEDKVMLDSERGRKAGEKGEGYEDLIGDMDPLSGIPEHLRSMVMLPMKKHA
eukprot:gnl/MRDRNA2_/MRDRNA2_57676_c0_seq1.p1 gnl/MRDRNA2_/MRDRNA2_57676_c0~~gnl/MRDRNA2_/MRDRNA2_57676_c0_seq1.p1  ORF type:complete len:333 (+),score=65.07 gnl/MRDRNA2_/MRDRNA2_57676_c0_seq1:77-1075(+)